MSDVLVIAANSDLRRSLQFALEAEGYAVAVRSDLPDGEPSPEGFDCTIVDHHLLDRNPALAVPFCTSFAPVILLANRAPHRFSTLVFCTVLKPLLGPALSAAVGEAVALRRVAE
jgi:hypothetical protein